MSNNTTMSDPNMNVNQPTQLTDDKVWEAVFKILKSYEHKLDESIKEIKELANPTKVTEPMVLGEVVYKSLSMNTDLDDDAKKKVSEHILILLESDHEDK